MKMEFNFILASRAFCVMRTTLFAAHISSVHWCGDCLPSHHMDSIDQFISLDCYSKAIYVNEVIGME